MKKHVARITYGFLVGCMLVVTNATISAEDNQIEIAPDADTIVLSREQAIKIMNVLQQVAETYSKDGTLDLVGEGARASIAGHSYLEEIYQCLALVKASAQAIASNTETLSSLQLVDTSIYDAVVALKGASTFMSAQIADNQISLVSLLEQLVLRSSE